MTTSHRKREASDTYTEIGKLNNRIEEVNNMQELLTESFNKLQASNDSLVQLANISIAMLDQEEQDRANISLIGQKDSQDNSESKKRVSPVLVIDKPTVLRGQIMSSFKMACLAYNPSPVKFRDLCFP